jgi:DNA-binding transcriptional LysR family regulator
VHDLNDIQYFAAVVEHQGFSAAARALNVPKSSVSRHIANLEARLGVRLLERSTRSVRCTEVGTAFYDQCRAILSDLDAAERDVAVRRAQPIGLVRMSCPTGLSQFVLAGTGLAIAVVAELGKLAGAPLEIGRSHIIEHQRSTAAVGVTLTDMLRAND